MNKSLKFIIDLNNHYNIMKGGEQIFPMDNKVFVKSIQNPIDTPWLDWIQSGVKTYELRLNKPSWQNIRVNDIIIWKDWQEKNVETMIVDLKYFKSFGEAFKNLGQKMVPIKGIDEKKVINLYEQYYSEVDTKKYGVVAMGLKVLKK